jgi:hypothetical protein
MYKRLHVSIEPVYPEGPLVCGKYYATLTFNSLWHRTLAPKYKPTGSQLIMNVLNTVILQITELHPAFMQLVQTAIIRAQNICISTVSVLLSGTVG